MQYYPTYVFPYDYRFGQFNQFSGYHPQYPVTPYYVYPSYNPWHYHRPHDGWVHDGWPGQWHNEYSGATITDIDASEEDERWPKWPPKGWPSCGFTGYKSNKTNLKGNVEAGGWIVAWADDISETDVAAGVVAAGVSVVSAEPGPFLLWIENLVDRTIASISASAKENFPSGVRKQIEQLAADVIKSAIQGKSAREATKDLEGFGVKAGAIKYSGRNMFCGKTITSTWGMKPYIAIRIIKI